MGAALAGSASCFFGAPLSRPAPLARRTTGAVWRACVHTPGPHKVSMRGVEATAEHGETLRTALLKGKVTPHNGRAQVLLWREYLR